MKKTIDAVKMVRVIRDRLYQKTKKMSRQELIQFYRTKSHNVHAGLKRDFLFFAHS